MLGVGQQFLPASKMRRLVDAEQSQVGKGRRDCRDYSGRDRHGHGNYRGLELILTQVVRRQRRAFEAQLSAGMAVKAESVGADPKPPFKPFTGLEICETLNWKRCARLQRCSPANEASASERRTGAASRG